MLSKDTLFEKLLVECRVILAENAAADERLQRVCDLLKKEVPYYDWVGFYVVDPKWRNELYLGPYAGAPTEHTRIMFGKGICGQAASTKEVFIIQDVSKETNYLSCSPKVKSEIVLPIFNKGEIWGELDIDSHTVSPFSEEDTKFLAALCVDIGRVV